MPSLLLLLSAASVHFTLNLMNAAEKRNYFNKLDVHYLVIMLKTHMF